VNELDVNKPVYPRGAVT